MSTEHTLDQLIAKVKNEAIDAANKEANQIIDEANVKAEQILQSAMSKKSQILEEAKSDSEDLLNKGQLALHQAARDVEISLKNDLLQLFKSVLESEIASAFTTDVYSEIIKKIVDTLGERVDISLPEETEDQLLAAISKKVTTANTTLKILKKEKLLSGISIAHNGEGWSYDISAKEISELLSKHLSVKWVTLLNKD